MRNSVYHMSYWVVFITVVILHFFLGFLCFLTPSPRINHRKLSCFCVRIIGRYLKIMVNTHNMDDVADYRGCVFMANHTSMTDVIVLLMTMPVFFNFLSKKETRWIPFIGLSMMIEGDFFIDRKNFKRATQSLERVGQAIKKGRNVLIFPEGTRSTNGQLLPFKKGGFRMAIDAQVPIVPIQIIGGEAVFKKGSLRAQPGHVDVYVKPPIKTHIRRDATVDYKDTLSTLMDETARALSSPSNT